MWRRSRAQAQVLTRLAKGIELLFKRNRIAQLKEPHASPAVDVCPHNADDVPARTAIRRFGSVRMTGAAAKQRG